MRNNAFYTQATTSSSAIMSAVTGAVKQWWLTQFPVGFFNTVRITTGIASIDDSPTESEILKAYKKNNPALGLRPRMMFSNDTIGSVPKALSIVGKLWQDDGHFYTVYRNEEQLQDLKFELERYKVNFSVGIRVESELQMIDIIGYLNKKVSPDNLFYISEVPFVVEIPTPLLTSLASDLQLNLNNKDELTLINKLEKKSNLIINSIKKEKI